MGDKATSARDRALDKTCAALLSRICQKFDNLNEVDKLAAVAKKVETVKLVVPINVDMALQNCVRLESIERAAGTMYTYIHTYMCICINIKHIF